jgi:hypothetical protein
MRLVLAPGNERAGRPGTALVDGPGQQLLARATLAQKQHRRIGGRDAIDQAEQLAHGGRGADDSREAIRDVDLAFESPVALDQPAPLDGPPHRQYHLLVSLERLREVVVGPASQGLDRRSGGAIARQHHHRQVGPDRVHAVEQLETIHARHVEIGDQQVERAAGPVLERRQGVSPRAERGHLIVGHGEHAPHSAKDEIVVVDQEDAARRIAGGVKGDLEQNGSDLSSPPQTLATPGMICRSTGRHASCF